MRVIATDIDPDGPISFSVANSPTGNNQRVLPVIIVGYDYSMSRLDRMRPQDIHYDPETVLSSSGLQPVRPVNTKGVPYIFF